MQHLTDASKHAHPPDHTRPDAFYRLAVELMRFRRFLVTQADRIAAANPTHPGTQEAVEGIRHAASNNFSEVFCRVGEGSDSTLDAFATGQIVDVELDRIAIIEAARDADDPDFDERIDALAESFVPVRSAPLEEMTFACPFCLAQDYCNGHAHTGDSLIEHLKQSHREELAAQLQLRSERSYHDNPAGRNGRHGHVQDRTCTCATEAAAATA